MEKMNEKFDVAVIGGGPAGMMAAGKAAELGARVTLLDRNESLGKKLLITGKGRCNITQAEFDMKKFIENINSKKGKFLFHALSVFGPEDVIDFFEKRNLKTKVERGGRVFPVSDKSADVLKVLIEYLKENKVEIISGAEVLGLEMKNGKIEYVKMKNGEIYADNFIIAVGGKSYALTGSTGDGYVWAEKLGHKIIAPMPALVPIKTREYWVKELQGLSLKNIEIVVWQDGKKQETRFGEMLFTHFGLSGPIILDVSKRVGELLAKGKVFIQIDLKPALDAEQLDKRLQRDFASNINKDFKNYLPELLPKKMIETIIKLSEIGAEQKINSISREQRKNLARLLKNLRLEVSGLLGYDQAIVTSGGVGLKEIDPRTMRSKIVGNLFFAGEVIDLDGPTGGYNLQICWSTGYLAGENAVKNIENNRLTE